MRKIDGLIGLVVFPLLTLGPGQRLGIWFQGCSRQCKECMSKHSWSFDEGSRCTLDNIVKELRLRSLFTDRLTISGGEPFEQPEFLEALLREARLLKYRDILVYSGFSASVLKKRFPWLGELIDALIDGPFDKDKPTDEVWRGSENQTLHIFSKEPSIIRSFLDWQGQKASGKTTFQLVKAKGGIALVGIPKDDRWKGVIGQ